MELTAMTRALGRSSHARNVSFQMRFLGPGSDAHGTLFALHRPLMKSAFPNCHDQLGRWGCNVVWGLEGICQSLAACKIGSKRSGQQPLTMMYAFVSGSVRQNAGVTRTCLTELPQYIV